MSRYEMYSIIWLVTTTIFQCYVQSAFASHYPVVDKLRTVWQNQSVVHLQLHGSHLRDGLEVQLTSDCEQCTGTHVFLSRLLDNSTLYFHVYQYSGERFVCIKWNDGWIHQGYNASIDYRDGPFPNIIKSDCPTAPSQKPVDLLDVLMRDSHSVAHRRDAVEQAVVVFGMRVESAEAEMDDDGLVTLLSSSTVRMRLFGEHLTQNTMLSFTTKREVENGMCEFPSSDIFLPMNGSVTKRSAVFEIEVPSKTPKSDLFYFCIKSGNSAGSNWLHQSDAVWMHFRVYNKSIPLWAAIIIIIMLLCCSALFSGLTLGLMSLDKTDLKVLSTTGSELERKYATAIMPVRNHGSLLLCSLLLGNVLVNSVLTILMDELTSGLVAVIFSTLAIVIFGEIMPQAFCARHGLAVGAKTIYITKFVIVLTAIVAWPISKILDFMLGEEIGNVYTRERLNELVKTGTNIEKDEQNIISGALQLSQKTVASVMTKLEDVFMLSYDTILDFETVSEIMNSGYSRVPVYEGNRSTIVNLLYTKDLAFVDPDDNTPLRTLCEFYQNSCFFVYEDLTLDLLFKKFKEGSVGHMAFVHRVNAEGEGDPFYETLGLITLEDVIEELIQAEIVDETDVWTDNRTKRKRERMAKKTDFTSFAEKREHQRIQISPQLTLATFQYLSTSVAPFKSPTVSNNILQRMLQQDVYRHIKSKNKEREVVYHIGRPVDYFVLILEGRVEVLVGKENLRFESGPFTYFGVQALLQPLPIGGESPTSTAASGTGSMQSIHTSGTFTPDYTVRPVTELFYVLIKRSLYIAACRATRLELSRKADDHFDDEVDKLLHIEDDDRSHCGSQSSRRTSNCGKESPLIEAFSGGDTGANGDLRNSKTTSEVCDPEERTTLLEPAGS